MKNRTVVTVGLLALMNVVLLATVAAMAAEPSVARSIGASLNLADASDVNELDARTSDLESAIGDTTGIDDLASSVDDLEYRLDDLETGSGDEAAESVDDISSRLDDLESELFNLDSELRGAVDDLCSDLSLQLDIYC